MYKYKILDYNNTIIFISNELFIEENEAYAKGYEHLEFLEQINDTHYRIEVEYI